MRVACIRGTVLGFDARWLSRHGLLLSLLLVLASQAAPLSQAGPLPWWARVGIGLSSVLAVLLTSLSHELGHAIAGHLAGLPVRAIVLGPGGGVTIRARSEHPHVNLLTAMAGPLANLLLAALCGWATTSVVADTLVAGFLAQVGLLQLVTSATNLLPIGPFDGARILAAWRALD
jgi:Zn-dependent protease